jgi:hypothetical protein
MNENIKERFLILSNYDTKKTLTENFDNIKKDILLEGEAQTAINTLMDVLGLTAKDGNAVFKKIRSGSKGLSKFKTLEEFKAYVSSLKGEKQFKSLLNDISGGLSGSARIAYKEAIMATKFGENMTKVLKIADKNPEALKKMFKYYESLGLTPTEIIEMTAKTTGRDAKEITALVNNSIVNVGKTANNLKDLKAGSPEIKQYIKEVPDASAAAKNVEQVAVEATNAGLNPSIYEKIGKKIGFYVPAGFAKIKNLTSKMNFRKLVLYGLAGYGGYLGLKNLFSDDPNPSVLDPCVVNSNDVELLPTSTGDIMGYIKTTGNEEYDNKGGLKFYSNGRVFLGDLSKKGKYSCSTGGQLKLGESTKKKKLNEETVLGNIEINWDIPGGGGENESSLTGSFKRVCADPYSRGCKETDPNGPLHKVQSCLGVKSDGLFGGKTEGALFAKTQSKSFMAKDVDKICSSSGGGGSQQPTQDPEYTIDTQNTEAGETDTEGV